MEITEYKYHVLGLNFQTTPIEIREKFVSIGENYDFLQNLFSDYLIELVVINTCNRFEIYTVVSEDITYEIIEKLKDELKLDIPGLEKLFYTKFNYEVVLHLFKVSAGLDSMVIGENEIFGQVKNSYSMAVKQGFSGVFLNKLFHRAFRTVKQIKTETMISNYSLSTAYIALLFLKDINDKSLSESKILLLGAGRVAELFLKYLMKEDFKELIVLNRSLEKAKDLIKKYPIITQTANLSQIDKKADKADIIISAINADDFILTADKIKSKKSKIIIDMGVPRTIDPECDILPDVKLFNIDALQEAAQQNLAKRKSEYNKALQIAREEASRFLEWYKEFHLVPLISRLYNKYNLIRSREIEKFQKKDLKHLSEKDFQIIEELTINIMKKILHDPIIYLKEREHSREKCHKNTETKKIIEEMLIRGKRK